MKTKTPPISVKVGNVTVKIYRVQTHGLPSFQVADYSSGKRRLISFSDETKARAKASDIARNQSRAESGVISISTQEKAVYSRALDAVKGAGIPLDIAAMNYAGHLKIAGSDDVIRAAIAEYLKRHHTLTAKTVRQAVDELIVSKTTRTKKGKPASADYIRDLESRLGRFADAFQCNLADVQPADVRTYLDNLKISGRTWFNTARVIRTFFKFAQGRKLYPSGVDPFEGLEVGFVDDGAIEIFRPEEIAIMLQTVRPEFLPFIAIGAFSGLRTAEISRLDWAKVNLESGYITVDAENAKTASRRIVPIQPNLNAWLADHAKKDGPVVEFANTAKQIVWLVNDVKAVDGWSGFEWKHNGLRHSYISYRLADCQDVNKVAMEAGNSPQMIFKHYRELVTQGQGKAWFSVQPATPSNVVAMSGKAASK